MITCFFCKLYLLGFPCCTTYRHVIQINIMHASTLQAPSCSCTMKLLLYVIGPYGFIQHCALMLTPHFVTFIWYNCSYQVITDIEWQTNVVFFVYTSGVLFQVHLVKVCLSAYELFYTNGNRGTCWELPVLM